MDQYQGADAAGLEDKIKQLTENDPGNSEDSDIPKGYVSGHYFKTSKPGVGNLLQPKSHFDPSSTEKTTLGAAMT